MSDPRKVLVIHPPQEVEADYIDYPYFSNLAPATLAAALERSGAETHFLDSLALPGASVVRLRNQRVLMGVPTVAMFEPLAAADFDVVFVHFSVFSLESPVQESLRQLVAKLRNLRPQALIVGFEGYVGGMHRGPVSTELIRRNYPQLDHFIEGESEDAALSLLTPDQNAGFHLVGQATAGPTLNQANEGLLDIVNWPLYRDFLGAVGRTAKAAHYGIDEHSLPVFFSRGCPFQCTFCTNPGRNFRPISTSVIRPILATLKQRDVSTLFVLDDAANVHPQFEEVLRIAEEDGVRLRFPNGLRADLLTQEIVARLKRVSDELTVSAESASSRVQKEILDKGITAEDIERVASWCFEEGLPLRIHWMVGIPGETAEELLLTLITARRLLDEYGAQPLVQYATPLPGTQLQRYFPTEESGTESPTEPSGKHGTEGSSDLAMAPVLGGAEVFWSGSLGWRMQHEPSHVPEGIASTALTHAVKLLRQRGRDASTTKVIVNITYRCNNHCVFCAVGNRVKDDLSLDYVKKVLGRYRSQGVRMLDLDGGEPTLHPNLFEILEHARTLGYSPISITSNGRRLAYKDFARKLVTSGLNNILVSLHGPRASVHEAITLVPGSYEETMTGIRNVMSLKPADLSVGVNTTLSQQNYLLLDEMVEQLEAIGVQQLNIQFLTPFGRVGRELVPDPLAAAEEVRKVIGAHSDSMVFQVINLPYCFLPGLESYVAQDLGKLSRNMVFVTQQEVNLYEYLATTRRTDDQCTACLFQVACDGKYDFSEVLD